MDSINNLLKERDDYLCEIRKHLKKAQEHMKYQANKKRRMIHFSEGDMVWLKLVP